MNTLRTFFNISYDLTKPFIFSTTQKDPEIAHKIAIKGCQILHTLKLEKLVLDNYSNKLKPPFKISNAAGLNKNGEIHPEVLRYLGFDRVVIGTITGESYKGNQRPRIKRYSQTESLVNWMGLPGEGAEKIAERISNYKPYNIPLTINLMATPKKQKDEALKDLEKTVLATRDLPYVDRFELNISCPNTQNEQGDLDARKHYQEQSESMIKIVEGLLLQFQELYIKVSPDLTEEEIIDTIAIISRNNVSGITTTNTTTNHNLDYIPYSPRKGGASGKAVYKNSFCIQKMVYKNLHQDTLHQRVKIIACGGIDSKDKVRERLEFGAEEIQIYTPLIFKGPKLLRNFREIK